MLETPKILDAESFEKTFSIKVEPKLKIKEKLFLDKLMKKLSKTSYITFFSLGELYTIFKTKDLEIIKNELMKLSRKRIYFTLFLVNREVINGEFYILTSIYIKNDGIFVVPPLELIYSLDKKSIFSKIDLSTFMRFKEKHTFNFYPEVIKHYDRKGFEYSIEELKKLFGVENDYYERFYDFEKNIIKPIINDINKSSNLEIYYEKIKSGSGKTNKIKSLNFSFVDTKKAKISNDTNLLIHSIKNNIEDIPGVTKIIENSFLRLENKEVFKIINLIKSNFDDPIDVYLKVALTSEFRMKDGNIKILDIQEKFKSCFRIEGRLYKELSKFKFNYNYYFLKELQELRINGSFNYEISPWIIKVKYRENDTSNIKIYLKLEED